MLSNRTSDFKVHEEQENIDNKVNKFIKQLTTPLPKFDMHFKFSKEEEKEISSFSQIKSK